MNSTGKWLVRAGSILIMLGFVMPFMTVSCSAVPGLGQSLSLVTLTSLANQSILYLVPFGALIVIVLSFLPSNNRSTILGFYWGQVIGIGAGLLSVIICVTSLNNQIGNLLAFKTSPEIGAFLLIGGYVLSLGGLIPRWREMNQFRAPESSNIGSAIKPTANYNQPPPIDGIYNPALSNPRLQGIGGSFSNSIVPITSDYFTVGRASDNDLQLHDMKVSRQHACLRFAHGNWFIQDRESSGGLWVNDQPVQAIQLNPGDKITIGEETFIFYL